MNKAKLKKIKNVTIENYKSYALETKIEFSNLNIITGANSSGKSSLIESLLILAQSGEHNTLNGHLKKLGNFDNLNNKFTDNNDIRFLYGIDDSKFSIVINENNVVTSDTYNQKNITDIVYLSADRIGVLDCYKKNRDSQYFGPRGEELISLLYETQSDRNFVKENRELFIKENSIHAEFDNFPIYESNPISQLRFDGEGVRYLDEKHENAKLINVVNNWFEILTGYTISINEISSQLLQVLYHKDGLVFEPQHVGTGVTFILFQIIAALVAPAGYKVIIENPEIHLHPSLQSQLMYFYQWISESGRQIFIETHSDHIFNIAKYFKVENRDCTVLFAKLIEIEDDEFGRITTTQIQNIQLEENGDIIDYPDGLFDQYLKDNNKFYNYIYSK